MKLLEISSRKVKGPTPKLPLWHNNYFELKAVKEKQT
jgi:hypothetical protein